MNEPTDGVRMLVEHLTNIKLANEEREFQLRQTVKELESHLKDHQEKIRGYQDELFIAKNQVTELKNHQTKKWKHQALDDWKALVNKLNEDRSRLEEEVSKLKLENDRLTKKLEEEMKRHLGPDGAGQQEQPPASGEGSEYSMEAAPPSGSSDMEQQLRWELERAKCQVSSLENEKKIAEIELRRMKREIRDVIRHHRGDEGRLVTTTILQSLGKTLGLWGGKARAARAANYPVFSV